jgi:hypothetical protein
MLTPEAAMANVDWAFERPRLNTGAKLLLVWLSRMSDGAGEVSATMPDVAVATGMDRRSVQRNLRALEFVGLIQVHRVISPGGRFRGLRMTLARHGT